MSVQGAALWDIEGGAVATTNSTRSTMSMHEIHNGSGADSL